MTSLTSFNQHTAQDGCETAILRVFNDVLCSADGGDLVLLALLDLSATFDTTDHEILLMRLSDDVGISSMLTSGFVHT